MKSAAFLLFIVMIIQADEATAAERRIWVRDDAGAGIKSVVFINSADPANRQGSTDEHGDFALQKECELVVADPDDPFYTSGDAKCATDSDPIKVRVTRMEFAENLIWNAQRLESSGDSAKAALVFAEYADRMNATDPQRAYNARQKSLQLFGQFLGVSPNEPAFAFDPVQGKNVMSPEMASALQRYQARTGIKVTGVLDYKTLSTAAGEDIYPFLIERVQY